MKQATIHHSKKKVFEAVKEAAAKLDLEIRDASSANGRLSLYSRGGLLSFGNKIDVEIKIADTTKSIVKVSSQSAAAIQVIDWGTNRDLEEEIIAEVKSILG
jgi:hypothetical protein